MSMLADRVSVILGNRNSRFSANDAAPNRIMDSLNEQFFYSKLHLYADDVRSDYFLDNSS